MKYQVYIDNDQISLKTTHEINTAYDVRLAASTIRANNEDIPLEDYRVKRLSDGKVWKNIWKTKEK